MSTLSPFLATLAAWRLALRASLALIPVFLSAGLAQPVCQLTRLLQIFWTLLYALGTLVQRGFARRSRGLSPVVQYVRILSTSLMAVVVPCLLGLSSAHAQTSSANASKIAAGGEHTCALTTAGGVKCWGSNRFGVLGDGSYIDRQVPVNVQGLANGVSAIAAGSTHTCALTIDGGVKCWGRNYEGQLGNNGNTIQPLPADVQGLASGVSAIATGTDHTCALTTAGGVKCWGFNGMGQLGAPSNGYSRSTPVDVQGLASGVSAIATGGDHTCALTNAGGVKCWGGNLSGELGDPSITYSSLIPVNVQGLASGVSAIATGSEHTCALTTAGGVKCWDRNLDGALGDNSTINSMTPINVQGLASGVSAIAAGSHHTCALTTNGGVKCWGNNWSGELGDDTITNRLTPVNVSGLRGGLLQSPLGIVTLVH